MRTKMVALVAGALGALLGSNLYGLGSAQEQYPSVSINIAFVTNADTFTDGSAENLVNAVTDNAPGVRCIPARPKFRVLTGPGPDPARLDELETGRKEEIARVLRGAGFDNAETLFTVEFDRTGRPDGRVMVIYETARDESPPMVDVDPTQKQVRPEEEVSITIQARDISTPWDRGIQRIELRDLTNGGTRVGGEYGEYGRIINRCDASTLQQEVVVPYRVSRNPPLLIRLEALAHDKADNVNGAVAVLTTGKFSGRFEWGSTGTAADGSVEEASGDYDFSFDTDAEGVVTGPIIGWHDVRFEGSSCPNVRLSRGSFEGSLVGSHTGGTFSISMETADRDEDYPKVKYCGLGAPEGPHRVIVGFVLLSEAFSRLRAQPDGSLKSLRTPAATTGSSSDGITYTLTVTPRK